MGDKFKHSDVTDISERGFSQKENRECCDTSEQGSDINAGTEPERRFIDGKWFCEDGCGGFLMYEGDTWVTADDDNIRDKWNDASDLNSSKCYSLDGVTMEWNSVSQQWLPAVEVNEDFLANYHANYGIKYDYSGAGSSSGASGDINEGPPNENLEEPTEKKPKIYDRNKEQGWIELDENRNTSVYVTNLPSTITEQEFVELMSKCGVIQRNPRTNKLKVKIYLDEDGNPKGDATCGYIKKESVDLALKILDGWKVGGNEIQVQKAKFEMKGEFDPSKKRKKLTPAQKKRYIENQERIFEWKPEKPRNYRPISDCTVVMKYMFTLDQMMKNAALLMDLEEETRKVCERFGPVKKVVVHDNNPDGVICVTFENVEHSDAVVRSLNGRVVGGRAIEVSLWDGKTKYNAVETHEQSEHRLAGWHKFIAEEE